MTTKTTMACAPGLTEWREQVRGWLASTLPPKPENADHDDTDFAVFRNLSDEDERDLLDAARAYQRAKFDAGYQALTLAPEHGGRGLSAAHASVFAQEEAGFAVPPSTELISVTVGLIGSAVAVCGTPEQRDRFARAFQRTDLLACQLFSEPGAGSDLAALGTRAIRSGDEWIATGQKVWSSGARYADYGMLLARTDPNVVKQAGITAFLVPMTAQGLTIQPIRQINGGASFNEVFLSDVRIPDSLRLGEPGQGWEIANATLAFERTASGAGKRRKGGSAHDVIALAQRLGKTGDPVVRQRLAELYIRSVLHAATVDRVARATAAGQRPGSAASVTKLLASENLTLIGQVAAELLGSRVAADTGEPATFAWTQHLLGAPGYRVAGGTDQIQRNLIGERVLGLPGEPRVDKVPFTELTRS